MSNINPTSKQESNIQKMSNDQVQMKNIIGTTNDLLGHFKLGFGTLPA